MDGGTLLVVSLHAVKHQAHTRFFFGRGLDFTPPEDDNFKLETPVIVVMHGLTGGMLPSFICHLILRQSTGSYESYVRSILAPACAPIEQGGLGYRAVVLNFRGCKYIVV
jgi:predicted alpha/beta-fold hydrolase